MEFSKKQMRGVRVIRVARLIEIATKSLGELLQIEDGVDKVRLQGRIEGLQLAIQCICFEFPELEGEFK